MKRHGALVALCLALLHVRVCQAADRVVAIGDVHGAYQEFVSILQTAGLIGKDLNWTGGKTILVQTGDVVDRGPESRKAEDLVTGLVDKARRQGGEVRPLLGNHEVMLMTGFTTYTVAEDYQSFAGNDSEKVRQREFQDYVKYREKRAARFKQPKPQFGNAEREAWMKAHPPGYFELRRAYASDGQYGRLLRRRDTVTQVDDTIFVHGGLAPDLPFKSLREINERVRKELEVVDQAWTSLTSRGILWRYLTIEEVKAEVEAEAKALQAEKNPPDPELEPLLAIDRIVLYANNGPLWYRGYAQQPEGELAAGLDRVLQQFGVKQMVMGHTVLGRSPMRRFGGKAILIDTGMLVSFFQGRPSALEISGGTLKALYIGEPAQPVASGGAAGPTQTQ